MEFMLGCNYWGKKHGIDMWRDFDLEGIKKDVKMLADVGVKYMRVFPNWRDFQPFYKVYAYQGEEKGYCDYNEQPLTNVLGIDYQQIDNFKQFAAVCEEHGIKLVVSILTGWMSGRLYLPRGLDGKNALYDPEVLMWASRFIKGFVEGVKGCKNIVMWDLGNESNCLGAVNNQYEAYVWLTYVRNAIYAADTTRPISSGMHGLAPSVGNWWIQHQGEIVDYLTPHSYASPSVNNDFEQINRMRTTMLPTAQCMYYEALSGKSTILQEQGTFSQAFANADLAAGFGRVNILSSFVHGVKGWMWWCGANHSELMQPPYCHGMMERDLSLFTPDDTPRPIAHTMKEMSELIDALPFEELPKRDIDAVCVLTSSQETRAERWNCASASFVLGKQAGIDVTFADANNKAEVISIPDSDLYILPCIAGWEVMNQYAFKKIYEKVAEGATLYISYNGGDFFHFEEYTGLRSNGIVRSRTSHTASFEFGDVPYACEQEILVESVGAEPLVYNEEGNIVLSRFNYGKGRVFFLNMPLESTLAETYGAYAKDYYKIYKFFADKALSNKIVTTPHPDLSVTQHKVNDERYIIAAVNYSNEDLNGDFTVADGWKLTGILGADEHVGHCNASFYYADKQ